MIERVRHRHSVKLIGDRNIPELSISIGRFRMPLQAIRVLQIVIVRFD